MIDTFNAADKRAVVAGDTADELGKIKAFIVDVGANRVEAVQVSGRGRKADIVPWERLRFGGDAVIADSGDAPEQVSDDRDLDAVKGRVTMRGSRVLDTSGFELGTVEDVSFDSESGALVAVRTTDGEVDASHLCSLGSYALVVDAEE
ncbi:MAG: PRC-barrel domain-containing protein [Microthrixaceae bacterium]|nr:PRC-barrel domain-containing protein [Microthrixaceae bacterium]